MPAILCFLYKNSQKPYQLSSYQTSLFPPRPILIFQYSQHQKEIVGSSSKVSRNLALLPALSDPATSTANSTSVLSGATMYPNGDSYPNGGSCPHGGSYTTLLSPALRKLQNSTTWPSSDGEDIGSSFYFLSCKQMEILDCFRWTATL